MAIPFTAEINPRGATPQEKQADLISQLRVQNKELRILIQDLYKEIDAIKKGEKK